MASTAHKSDTVLVTVVSLMTKVPGAEHATPCTQLTVQTANNGTQYAIFKLREGGSALPDGVIDMRPTRTKTFFADAIDLTLLKAGAKLCISRSDWDDGGASASEDAPF
tara:strand:+ start:28915 stop:29241 length:327 start_codon:yes stop_codon:yes gene_type:complete